MKTIRINKNALTAKPCKSHKVKSLSYAARMNLYDKMYNRGDRQKQCGKCGRWLFECEF